MAVEVTGVGARMASAKESIPHNPHPAGPAMRRRRASSASRRAGVRARRHSTPASNPMISRAMISHGAAMIPSDSENPTAKSSRSRGVAIITAKVARS